MYLTPKNRTLEYQLISSLYRVYASVIWVIISLGKDIFPPTDTLFISIDKNSLKFTGISFHCIFGEPTDGDFGLWLQQAACHV